MNLKDWCSNSVECMSEIPQQDRANREKLKVLGITWTPQDDQIAISVPKLTAVETLESSSTKREVLQSIASIFDPLGLFSPLTLMGKYFM